MPSHTIKVTGVSDELLQLLDQRVHTQHATGRAEYIRELIRKDILGTPANGGSQPVRSFRDILAPIHEATERQGYSDEEIDQDLDDAIQEFRANRRRAGAPR